MKFSEFVDVFVAALYNETKLTGSREFRISDILQAYGLDLSPIWADRMFDDYTFSSRVDARRHLGPIYQQRVSLSADGLRWVEDELGENTAAFLEQHGVFHESQRGEKLPEGVTEITGGRIFMSDGPVPDSFEGQPGDVHFEISSGTSIVDSSSWTGLPKAGILTEEASGRLLIALKLADQALDQSQATNEVRSQARAYIVAIQALSEAPEPPADLIWQLVNRANSIAGIAAFFVSLMALFGHA